MRKLNTPRAWISIPHLVRFQQKWSQVCIYKQTIIVYMDKTDVVYVDSYEENKANKVYK